MSVNVQPSPPGASGPRRARPGGRRRGRGAVAAGATAASGGRRPSCRWPGSRSTWRWPTWTARSTTGCRPTSTRPRVPGVRLRVRFAGRLVDGFLLERVAESAHGGTLAWVEKVVSAEPVLTAEVARLCRAVADRYAGVLADVLRLAVPPRHARVEAEPAPEPPAAARDERPDPAGWARYPHGPALLDALAAGRAAHAVWQALPGESWAERLAEAAAATVGRRARRPAGGARPARRRRRCTPPARRGLGAGPGGRAHRRARAGRALPALAGGAPRPGPGGGRHPVRRVRPGRAARPARRLGRRRRPARRTPRPVPARPRRAGCCAPTRPGPRCWSAGSAAPRRRSCWSSPAGRGRWWPTGPPCARRCPG